jgi:YesN/AraC family two-component response regulator
MILDKGINTIVVIISGYDDFEYVRESIRSEVFDYLLKPVMKDELYKVIDRIQNAISSENDGLIIGNEIFQKIIGYINQNYVEDIKLIDVAKQNYVSERYVAQLFKKYSKMSFLQYLTRLRMEKSKNLLKTTQKSITEIGREVGYPNSSYFNKVFKKFYHQTPNNFRKGDTYENKRHEV